MTEDSVVWLEEVGKEDIAIVGGKGASSVRCCGLNCLSLQVLL
ncbi:MAG: hypothetical protein MPEBLZ_00521 [Candidatus Methanoperedens nitroreducens]|uniref:Uncharacterized protein n=1 Tax=Candidatus Methanoperedens nitratireducens TaxID=1392998 RepID=A0A0P8E385_9EURY|nr:MAG: hypothetical protein MPEBLZ_00521 [Candidatus Methanoperedens sp. BLZ1]